jgi:hypothetical protein
MSATRNDARNPAINDLPMYLNGLLSCARSCMHVSRIPSIQRATLVSSWDWSLRWASTAASTMRSTSSLRNADWSTQQKKM